MRKYLISYIKINNNTGNEVNRSSVYECEGKMTEEELEKVEEWLATGSGWYTYHILSFSLIEEEEIKKEQKIDTTWIWVKLFDKRTGDEVPVYINSKNVRMIQSRDDKSLLVVVEGTENGIKKLSTFITKSDKMFITKNESTEGIPSTWIESHPVEPSVFYDGWLTSLNQHDSTPIE